MKAKPLQGPTKNPINHAVEVTCRHDDNGKLKRKKIELTRMETIFGLKAHSMSNTCRQCVCIHISIYEYFSLLEIYSCVEYVMHPSGKSIYMYFKVLFFWFWIAVFSLSKTWLIGLKSELSDENALWKSLFFLNWYFLTKSQIFMSLMLLYEILNSFFLLNKIHYCPGFWIKWKTST